MIGRYLAICEEVEGEFRRAKRLHGERIQCRAGCSDCCGQLFQITEVEAGWVSRGVRRLPQEVRDRMVEKAKTYLVARRSLTGLEEWGYVPLRGTRLPCPALDEHGACEIYEHRPLVCRKYGMPVWNADTKRLSACELNFKDGEELRDGKLIQIQTGIHERWKELQGVYNGAGGERVPEPICVGRAIVEDFSRFLEVGTES
jgi:Fe-S-cluster containining protein